MLLVYTWHSNTVKNIARIELHTTALFNNHPAVCVDDKDHQAVLTAQLQQGSYIYQSGTLDKKDSHREKRVVPHQQLFHLHVH